MASTAAAWVSAGAACFGAVGTVTSLLIATKLLRHQQRVESRQTEQREREVADLVTGWWTGGTRLEPEEADLLRGAVPALDEAVVIQNASHEPIYDVMVDRAGATLDEVEPTDWQVLRPQSQQTARILHKRDSAAGAAVGGLPRIRFTDSRGRRWCRDEAGKLSPLNEVVLPWRDRLREEGRRQDEWFSGWAVNPYVTTDRNLGREGRPPQG